MNASDWITALELVPHPEGGFYRETYRASETIALAALPDRFAGERAFSTAIYFLLRSIEVSALHRIRQDEVWHFYDGSTLTIHVIDPEGGYSAIRLGRRVDLGESLQAVVYAGCWFGASVEVPDAYALVGCTVAPGFDFADFELADRDKLLGAYPQQELVIRKLTREPQPGTP
jgi:predicted cupin superfamily sugar epimerase